MLNQTVKQICSKWHAGTWVTADAVLAHATAQSSSPIPRLVGRYPARTPIKDKEWPAIIEKALRAVQDSKALQGYDVVPSMLTDQYDLIGWLQVLHLTCSFQSPNVYFKFRNVIPTLDCNSETPGDSENAEEMAHALHLCKAL